MLFLLRLLAQGVWQNVIFFRIIHLRPVTRVMRRILCITIYYSAIVRRKKIEIH